jgi:CubicO group peptidase (beta-lactamase class C family)
LLLKSYGAADLELDVPTPNDAVYQIGSITKQFTAVAILQLAEQGKLSLDDDVTKYVPEFFTPGRRIALRQLLNHTSGLFDYVSLNGFIRRSRIPISSDSLVILFRNRPLDFAPGTAMTYSNSGYFVLGLVIERVSGEQYGQYVQQHLLDRIGMRDAASCSNERVVPRHVHGYDFDDGGLRLSSYVDYSWTTAVGSLCMTAMDLVTWTYALHHGEMLGAAAYRTLITPDTIADGRRLRYADGLVADSILGHRALHHGGDLPGFASEATYLPDDSLTVVVLINTEGPERPDDLSVGILSFYVTDSSAQPKVFGGRALDYVGTYRGVRQFQGAIVKRTFRIRADSASHSLTMQVDDGAITPLSFCGGDTFQHADTRITFIRAPRKKSGRFTALHVDDIYSALLAHREAGSGALDVQRPKPDN